MNTHSHVPSVMIPWMTADANGFDVTISSRVRVSRNLSGVPFHPTPANTEEYAPALETIREALRGASPPFGDDAIEIDPASIEAPARERLIDRGLLDESGLGVTTLFLSADERFAAAVGGVDHLSLSHTGAGLCLDHSLEQVVRVDRALESTLDFAAAMDIGYLSSRVSDIGTGLRASVIVHLPALLRRKRIARLLDRLARIGCEMQCLSTPRSGAFVVRNRWTVGFDEETIISKLDASVRRLVSLERKARETDVAGSRDMIRDQAIRAKDELLCARALTGEQVGVLAGDLRFALVAGVYSDVSLEAVTTLFFLARDGHISCGHEPEPEIQGEREYANDEARAIAVRMVLS